MHSDDENNSIWLFDVLDTIGVNAVYRKTREQTGIINEILQTFQTSFTVYNVGSTIEGTATPGEATDFDSIKCI